MASSSKNKTKRVFHIKAFNVYAQVDYATQERIISQQAPLIDLTNEEDTDEDEQQQDATELVDLTSDRELPNDQSTNECVICYDNCSSSSSMIVTLNCRHRLCRTCLIRCLAETPQCPFCRQPIITDFMAQLREWQF